ncbi:hypothetical protein [Parafilimonas sp.]|uniref:hypothetical protein n=1 Tax=Parafilimonas sp. TaxID=1969739 RepID=UPI0039E6F9EF
MHIDNLTFNDTASQFGIFINAAYSSQSPGATDVETNVTDSVKLLLDSAYGAKNIRIQINHDVWPTAASRDKFLTMFKNLWDKGFSPAVNILWNQPGSQYAFADSTAYAAFVSEILDSIDNRSNTGEHMKPGIVVVENEETNASNYINTTQAALNKYLGMLRQAAIVCHNKSVKITNGGIVCFLASALTWNWLKSTYDTSVANTWARKVFKQDFVDDLNAGTYTSLINLGKYLVGKYALVNYLSYINIHWYEPVIARYWPEDSTSPYDPPYNKNPDNLVAGALDSTIQYFNTAIPSLKLITNETGQLGYSQSLTNNMVNKYRSFYTNGGNFPIVIWYDGDADESEVISGAKALHNTISTTSYTLRNSGTKFENKMN